MRNYMISAALLASTVAMAAPAAAQWNPPVPQGYANGYNNNGQARRLEARVQTDRNQIRQLDRRNILSNREAQRLDNEARSIQLRIRQLGYNGLSGRERNEVEHRLNQLERNIQREASDGNNYRNAGWSDRDRDGRDDRYEDDRGMRRDN